MFWRQRLVFLVLLILLLKEIQIYCEWVAFYSDLKPISNQITTGADKNSDGSTKAPIRKVAAIKDKTFVGHFVYDLKSEEKKDAHIIDQQLFSQTKFYVSKECTKQIKDPLEPPECARISPTYIIAGAQKSGTTSLYMYLSKHPQVLALSKDSKAMGEKEVRFFDKLKNFTTDTDDYMVNFPSVQEVTEMHGVKTRFVVGESTPNYIRHPECPQRISQLLPDVKIIMLLRNPVDRAYSHYQHALRIDGTRNIYTGGNDFEAFVKAEEEMLETCDYLRFDWPEFSKCYGKESAKAARRLNIPKRKKGRLTWMLQSMMRGMYAGQLINFAKQFPTKQILVIQSEEFYNNTAVVMKRVEQFLGLQHFDWEKELKDTQIYNFGFHNDVFESSKSKDYDPLSGTLRKKMHRIFEQYNEELYELFDGSFPRWE